MNRSSIEEQILSLLDDDLSNEEVASLETILRNDPEALKTYARLVDMHNALETRFAMGSNRAPAAPIPMERVITRQWQRNMKRSLIAAAAVLVGLAVTLAIILTPSPPPHVANFKTTPDSRYSLVYEGKGEAPDGKGLAVGSRLLLAEGAFEGVFSNGVRLVAEAPCDLRVLSEDRVGLENGTAWFLVPPGATGFTAETPELVVVDLGTEFGVVSLPGDPDEVHVIAGSVAASARGGKGPEETLESGLARRMAADGSLLEIEANPSLFRKQLDSFSGKIANFTFTGPPWTDARENNFATFAAATPSEDTDFLSNTSTLSNKGHSPGAYDSFYIRDSDGGTEIFKTSATPGVGMNVANANQPTPTNYLSFTVRPASGYETEFQALSFYTGAHGGDASYQVELRAWDGVKETRLGSISHTTGPSTNEPVIFKSIDFADFTSRSPVEFRLYGYGIKGLAGSPESSGIRYDDIVLTGRSEAISGASGAND